MRISRGCRSATTLDERGQRTSRDQALLAPSPPIRLPRLCAGARKSWCALICGQKADLPPPAPRQAPVSAFTHERAPAPPRYPAARPALIPAARAGAVYLRWVCGPHPNWPRARAGTGPHTSGSKPPRCRSIRTSSSPQWLHLAARYHMEVCVYLRTKLSTTRMSSSGE